MHLVPIERGNSDRWLSSPVEDAKTLIVLPDNHGAEDPAKAVEIPDFEPPMKKALSQQTEGFRFF